MEPRVGCPIQATHDRVFSPELYPHVIVDSVGMQSDFSHFPLKNEGDEGGDKEIFYYYRRGCNVWGR